MNSEWSMKREGYDAVMKILNRDDHSNYHEADCRLCATINGLLDWRQESISSAAQMREALEKAVSWLNTLVHIPMSYTQRNQINQRIEEAESALRSATGEGVPRG